MRLTVRLGQVSRPVRALAVLAALLAVQGCSTTQVVAPHSEAPSSVQLLADVNRRARSQPVHVHLNDGRRLVVRGLRVGADSTTWIEGDRPVTVGTLAVRDVEFSEALRGVFEGGGLGLGLGAANGLALGTKVGLPGMATQGALRGGLMGALIGGVVGARRGHRHVYRFQH